jgi:hypothetical protein
MADIVKKQGEQIPDSMQTRYKDMGDETHAEVVYSGVSVGETIIVNQSRVDVAATSTAVIAANSSRKYLILINDSDTTIYLSFGGAAQLYAGVRLNSNGGSYEMGAAFGNNYTGAVYAIHGSTDTKRLLINEGV